MRVTNIKSKAEKTYTLTIEDGDVRDKPYANTGNTYRVQQVTVVLRDGNVASVSLAGHTLKKDGSDSANWTSERLFGQRDWPEWLNGVVGGLA